MINKCVSCGLCCKDIKFTIKINNSHRDLYLSELYSSIDGEYIYTLKTKDGTNECEYLTKDNTCSIYTSRPNICREFKCWEWYKMLDIIYKKDNVFISEVTKSIALKGKELDRRT